MTKSETPKAFFSRVLKLLKSPEDAFIHDRILLIGHVEWDTNHLRHLCLQSICLAKGSFDDWVLGLDGLSNEDLHYFRFDLHPSALGRLYSEPIPHIHSHPHGVPRFPFRTADTKTLIPDFIAFLFQNYAYDQWEKWIDAVWKDNTRYPRDENPIETIKEAFRDSQTMVLMTTFEKELIQLKALLIKATLEASRTFHPISDKLELLSM